MKPLQRFILTSPVSGKDARLKSVAGTLQTLIEDVLPGHGGKGDGANNQCKSSPKCDQLK